MSEKYKYIVVAVLAIIIFVFVIKESNKSINAIHYTNECLNIFDQKSKDYFGNEGKSRFIYSSKLKSCLIFNVLDIPKEDNIESIEKRYRLIVVDMISDDILFYYDLGGDNEKDEILGITEEEALNKVREFGFVIF